MAAHESCQLALRPSLFQELGFKLKSHALCLRRWQVIAGMATDIRVPRIGTRLSHHLPSASLRNFSGGPWTRITGRYRVSSRAATSDREHSNGVGSGPVAACWPQLIPYC